MATAEKSQSAKTQTATRQYAEPKRLSKAAIWKRNNPGGIIVVLDRRAVNR
ncbi:MAG: hypothetical protein LBR49_07860 [Tannerella sp.]|jgi:hypothetical protein|nr:hypothetical protein [Tannerella sp.]